MKYHPTFIQREATIDFVKIVITFFQSVKDKGLIIDDQHPERGHLLGWFLKSQFTRMGYASEII